AQTRPRASMTTGARAALGRLQVGNAFLQGFLLCELEDPHQSPVGGGLGCGRTALLAELAQRQRRVAQSELRKLAERRRELVEPPGPLEPAHGAQLAVRGAAGSDEVRVVRVREPVRARTRLPHDG